MKKSIKIISFFLAMLLLVAPLLSCSGKKVETEESEKGEVPHGMVPEKVTMSEETYITTPATEDLAIADDGYSIYVNNVLYVYVERDMAKKDVEKLAKKYDAEIAGACDLDIYQFMFDKAMNMDDLSGLALEIEKEDCVELCDMDFLLSTGESYMPEDVWSDDDMNDGEFDSNPDNTQWAIKAINAPDAWDYLDMMDKVNVAVVEGNIDKGHEDLNIKGVVTPSGTAGLADWIHSESHGTHVAGIMAAKANNKKGIAGACAIPGTELYFCSNSSYITVKNAVFGLSELVKKHGVKVINISQYSNSEAAIISAAHGNKKAQDAIKDQASRAVKPLKRLLDDGYEFVIVVAAGNQNHLNCWKDTLDREGYGYTTSSGSWSKGKTKYKGAEAEYAYYLSAIEDKKLKDRIIVVGAAMEDGDGFYKSCSFSNTGDRVDIMAPGHNIYSCMPDNKYGYANGTSQAAPLVSGVAAMLFGCDSTLTGAEVKDIIVSTADYSKKFDKVNAGFLQADRAVEEALGICYPEEYKGIYRYVDYDYGSLCDLIDDLHFFETMDYSGKWFATGYYEDKASVTFEFDGSDAGDADAIPVSMTVSSLGNKAVLITEDVELGMDYQSARSLKNVEVTREESDFIVLCQMISDEIGISMIFDVDGLESALTSVTVFRENNG